MSEVVKKDGIRFSVMRGAPASVYALEQSLNEVKGLHEGKFGQSVDEEVVQKHGIHFSVTRGSPPSMDTLEQNLKDVKVLFAHKFGVDYDSTSSDDSWQMCNAHVVEGGDEF